MGKKNKFLLPYLVLIYFIPIFFWKLCDLTKLNTSTLMFEPSILQYRLQKDQQMLKEVVDVLLIRSNFFLPLHVSACSCHPQGVVSA
jgi:hypothetical protein